MASPKVGERVTPAGPFRFYAMPAWLIEAGSARLEDIQDLRHGYPRATPERALVDWIYLGTSLRSRVPLPPLDIQLREMSLSRITRIAKAMGAYEAWERWHRRWLEHDASVDVTDNASTALGF